MTTEAIVALTRCENYDRKNICTAVTRQFELLGGLEKFISPGDKVLLKPNFIAPKSTCHATQTHPAVIIEVARRLIDFGAKPFVADSPAWGNVTACVKALKMEDELDKLGVPYMQLNQPKPVLIGKDKRRVNLSSIALDADKIINLPKFKSHQQLRATFAVKNMFGCVSGKQKAYWHFTKGAEQLKFCEFLIEIFKRLSPVLTIIDAVVAMDGPGPIRGRPRPLGWLIGGSDPISCEVICSKLINTKPLDMPMIQAAKQLQFGCPESDKIEICGDQFNEHICYDFEQAELIPIKFSLPRVIKSVCKQVILRLRKKPPVNT